MAIQLPCRALLSAPSGAGKSHLVLRIIQERAHVLSHPLSAIIYCFGQESISEEDEEFKAALRAAFPDIIFHVGLPPFSDYIHIKGHKAIIFDDMVNTIVQDKTVFDIVTRVSRRCKMSLFFLSQNLFQAGRFSKALSRNCNIKFIWDDIADKQWVSFLNRQVEPEHKKFLPQVMTWLRYNVKNYYDQYLVLDASRNSKMPVDMRVRTQIFPDKNGVVQSIYFHPSS